MALVECHECSGQLSTEAKSCPNCGASNRSSKKVSRVRHVLGVVVLAILLYLVFTHEGRGPPPSCESSALEETFEASSVAKENHLTVVDVVKRIDRSKGFEVKDRICEVTFRLSNTKELTYVFTFEIRNEGGYIIKARPK